jgi:hypothetical protein
MLKVTGSMSTKTGVAPSRLITSAVATKVKGGREDGVAGADPQGHQGHQQGVRPRGAADGVFDACVGGQLRFQLPDLRPVDVLAVGQDPGDPGADFRGDEPLLGRQIDKVHGFSISL